MERVPPVLRMRLGQEAADGLEDYADTLIRDWRDDMMQTAAERFDGRLAGAAADLRIEMQRGIGELAQSMADLRVSFHRELAATRAEMLRWSFVFWIGQLAAMAGLLALMLRGVAPR